MPPPSVSYVSMEPLLEGHASYTHVMEIVEGLRASGCDVHLFAPRYRGEVLPGGWRRFFAMSWLILHFFRCGGGDVLYTRWHFAAFPAVIWSKLRGMKIVIEVNGTVEHLFAAWPWTRRIGPLFTWLMDAQMRHADGVIAVTSGLMAFALERCRQETRPAEALITNGANTDLFHPGLPKPQGLPERYAVFVGAMAPWKGVAIMLDALRHEDWPEGLHLVLAGDGIMRPEVEKAAAGDARLHYLGRLPYRELPPVIANSAVGLVMTVKIRGGDETALAPLKLFEFMACGIPVIATEVPGQAEIVRRAIGTEFLIEPGSADALVRALRTLLAAPERACALGEAGAEWVRAEGSWAARARETRALIDRMLEEPRHRP